MCAKTLSKVQLNSYYENLYKYLEYTCNYKSIKYIDLGTHVVRLINYSEEFIPHIQKQLGYTLKDYMVNYDATIIIWKEENIKQLPGKVDEHYSLKTNLRLRIEMLMKKRSCIDLKVFDDNYSKHNPLIDINQETGIINAYDMHKNTYYYGVQTLESEEFIKQGHIFVAIFNKILKTSTSALVHGATVGLNNQGLLFCARGQHGKSTLAVLAMLKGFEYVSDDYLVLEKEGDKLYSYPIYSIITLSPKMYGELYYDFDGKFVSNNARKDKYVINIEKYHSMFRKKYPINVCIFPNIVNDKTPSIFPCRKGRAIVQLVHSTIIQMGDKHDIKTIKKLIDFIKDFKFYQINLCPDIRANVECLREFCEELDKKGEKDEQLCIK